MPKRSHKKKQPNDVKGWLENLSEEEDDDYARRFLQGNIPEDQDEIKEKSFSDSEGDPPSGESQNSDQVHFSSRMKGKKNSDDVSSDINQKHDTEKEESVHLESSEDSERADSPGVSLIDSDSELREMDTPDSDQLRGVAIKDYFPPPIKEKEPKPPVFTRIRRWFRNRSIFQKILLLCGGVLSFALISGLIFLLLHSLMISSALQNDSILEPSYPHPIKIILPDGVEFDLGLGTVEDGAWSPKGAEWLEGTELPRWVAIPWSRGLEEDVKGFKVSDVIQLFMSNSDIIFYRFQSIQEVAPAEISSFHPNSTDLLIVLSRKGSQSLIVIVAVP